MAQGHSEDSAWAICQSSINKSSKEESMNPLRSRIRSEIITVLESPGWYSDPDRWSQEEEDEDLRRRKKARARPEDDDVETFSQRRSRPNNF
jgi:hypothetical protein